MKVTNEKAPKTWVLTSVASLMVALDALVVTTALGTIRIDLGASNRFNAYVESVEAGAQRLSTRFDVRRPSDRAEGGK